ncbi:MAG: hypothetical protein ACOX4U_05180 [Anaerovoracaceae bacterium]|jgi:hypothetical protein
MKKTLGVVMMVTIILLASFHVGNVHALGSKMENDLVEIKTAKYDQRYYYFEDKGHFFIRKIDPNKFDEKKYITSYDIPGDKGVIRYFDSAKKMKTVELTEGPININTTIFIETDRYSMVLGKPYIYRNLGYETIEHVGVGSISVKKIATGYNLTYTFNFQKNTFGIMWGVGSYNKLLDLENINNQKLWGNYDLDYNARLSYNGYHYRSPNSYVPSTNKSFWLIPSDHLANALIGTGGSLASNILGNALININLLKINGEGFMPTYPKSTWLYNDYGIGGGFFDTRFNGDTICTYLIAYKKFGNEKYRSAYLKMAEYYMSHGEKNHYTISGNTGGEGWLVQDYYAPNAKKTLCALNHQLQAINAFYSLYLQEGNEKYLWFSDILLQGIKNSRNLWMIPHGDLHYAYMGNGKMGKADYPYLTYNDLYNVQQKIIHIKGVEDPDIKILMDHKRKWMDKNGVTQYKK